MEKGYFWFQIKKVVNLKFKSINYDGYFCYLSNFSQCNRVILHKMIF